MADNKKLFETEVKPVFLMAMADMNDEDKAFAKKVMALFEHLIPHVERFEATKAAHREEARQDLLQEHTLEITSLKRAHAHAVSHLETRCRLATEEAAAARQAQRVSSAPTELDGVLDPDPAVQHWRR